jgi:hypothetical protein
MGQAAVDLPDATEKAPAPLTSADDLLSQLAGAEIDRMLAAAEEKEPAATDVPSAEAPAAEAREATQPAKDAYSAEVDQLFKQLNTAPLELPSQEDAKTGAAPVDESPVEPLAAAAQTVAPPAPESNLQDAARAPEPAAATHLDPPVAAASTPALAPELQAAPPPQPEPITVAQAIESAVQEVKSQRASRLVQLLELINLPLERCPDAIRDLVGKLAILTFMNALGVLLYVALFKR